MTQKEVERALLAGADRVAEEFYLDGDPKAFLRRQARGAAARLDADSIDDADLERAENALRTLIRETEVERERRLEEAWPDAEFLIGQPSDEDLSRTLAGLCPGFWPFC